MNILEPGCGVGGHCIAVDPWFIVHMAQDGAPLIRSAREVNDSKPGWVVAQVLRAAAQRHAETGKDAVVACLGATYKADIDDLRESPALAIARSLEDLRATTDGLGRVLVVEPNVEQVPGVHQVGLTDALAEADILVFLVAHRAFRELGPAELEGKLCLDVCGVRPRADGVGGEA